MRDNIASAQHLMHMLQINAVGVYFKFMIILNVISYEYEEGTRNHFELLNDVAALGHRRDQDYHQRHHRAHFY